MKADSKKIVPVNIIAGGDINREVDMKSLAEDCSEADGVISEFTDDRRWQLVLRFENAGTVILYRTGSYIIRGGSSYESLERTKNSFVDLLCTLGIIVSENDIEYKLTNIVFTSDLNTNIDLAPLAVRLGMEVTEYEPEQFPGLIYRPEGLKAVVLIFSSGKLVITGTEKEVEAEAALDRVKEYVTESMDD